MRIIRTDTIGNALGQALHHMALVHENKQPSRNGPVIVSPYPIMTIYHKPWQRVLFSPLRDANPFFHVMESLWMLAGRNDLPWVAQFNKRMAEYSDDGGATQPAAYGYRWRNYFGYDQLETLITELKHNPTTRRAVLAMWDGGNMTPAVEAYKEAPGFKMGDLCNAIAGSKDVPCNTHCYFDTVDGMLNMTVMCRSNDIIWGAYGANAVHFSFLLEYVAAGTGLEMGVMRQFSNNFHIYTDVIPEAEMMPMARDCWETDRYTMRNGAHFDRVPAAPALRTMDLVGNYETFLDDLHQWFANPYIVSAGDQPFLRGVATPMFNSYMAFKAKNYVEAIEIAETIKAQDWQIACVEWLQRKVAKAASREVE